MSDIKWIKIMVDIFDDEKIQLIEALPSADTIIVIWFKILCLAGKNNSSGVLIMNDRIPYTDEMLAAIFRRNVNDVRMALEVFQRYGMIEIIENTYVIPNWTKHQSLDAYERKKERDKEYQRLRREQQKALIDGSEDGSEKKSSDNRLTVGRFCSYSSSISYSFKEHNNTNNLKYILDNNIYKDTKYITENKRLRECIESWMEYKDSRKPKSSNHYDEKGMNVLLNRIIKYHTQYGDNAVVDTIEYTIENHWQGIVWDWLKKNYKELDKPISKDLVAEEELLPFR